jgi:hypothetical protein
MSVLLHTTKLSNKIAENIKTHVGVMYAIVYTRYMDGRPDAKYGCA